MATPAHSKVNPLIENGSQKEMKKTKAIQKATKNKKDKQIHTHNSWFPKVYHTRVNWHTLSSFILFEAKNDVCLIKKSDVEKGWVYLMLLLLLLLH